MTASTTADLPQRTAPAGVRGTLRNRLQQFLAFASLIVIFGFFSWSVRIS